MIRINGKELIQRHFPDNTALLTFDEVNIKRKNIIFWNYENDAELFTIMCISGYLKDYGATAELYMPYIPHARMDRVKDDADVFTLKYFCQMINSCGFDMVYVLDPHSAVSEALLDRVMCLDVYPYIHEAIEEVCAEVKKEKEEILLFYPDEGSVKRYSSMINLPYAFGIKRRDWKTGRIEGLDIAGQVDSIKGKNILIVDDICSRGGTFYHSAKELTKFGADRIFLYVTHCENTIFDGEVLTSGLIDRVITTDSLYRRECDKIIVLNI